MWGHPLYSAPNLLSLLPMGPLVQCWGPMGLLKMSVQLVCLFRVMQSALMLRLSQRCDGACRAKCGPHPILPPTLIIGGLPATRHTQSRHVGMGAAV